MNLIGLEQDPNDALFGFRVGVLDGIGDQFVLPDGTVLIDGECVLCTGSFRFVARRDPKAAFRFAAVQSDWGRWAASRLGIDPDDPDTFAVVLGGRALLKSEGAIEILRRLPGWGWTAALLAVPRPLRDWAYDRVARNRYRLFGRLNACLVPDAEFRRHMVTGKAPECSGDR
jgi:predicted DCC family thiol-disulfide oxidoreductase YuxK